MKGSGWETCRNITPTGTAGPRRPRPWPPLTTGSPPKNDRGAPCLRDNYGRAAAIDFFGRAHGLPRAISNHNNYWIWGPRGATGEVVIILGGQLEDHRRLFEQVEAAGIVTCEHCMPSENDLTVYVCRRPRQSVGEVWPALKKFI